MPESHAENGGLHDITHHFGPVLPGPRTRRSRAEHGTASQPIRGAESLFGACRDLRIKAKGRLRPSTLVIKLVWAPLGASPAAALLPAGGPQGLVAIRGDQTASTPYVPAQAALHWLAGDVTRVSSSWDGACPPSPSPSGSGCGHDAGAVRYR